MFSNIPIFEGTSIGPQLQVFYITPISYFGALGSLFFEEANTSKFLKKFENICNDYQMSTSEKIYCLP